MADPIKPVLLAEEAKTKLWVASHKSELIIGVACFVAGLLVHLL